MKYLLISILMLTLNLVSAQSLVKVDAEAIYEAFPVPAATLAQAYELTYSNGMETTATEAYAAAVQEKIRLALLEGQFLLKDFYRQYPNGVTNTAKPAQTRLSEHDKSAMDAATTALAQKMMTDKAFAQQFAKMTEAEQRDYMTKMLADQGIKPAVGTPNTPLNPVPGTDTDWLAISSGYTQTLMASNPWERQLALQQKYASAHDAVDTWLEAEIAKLPMISMGEYGRDHDPEKVKSARKQALDKHRTIANEMMGEAAQLFREYRQDATLRCSELNEAIKNVDYGENYSFGIAYTVVLQAQLMIFGEQQSLVTNEQNIIREVARWEFDWRNFDKSN